MSQRGSILIWRTSWRFYGFPALQKDDVTKVVSANLNSVSNTYMVQCFVSDGMHSITLIPYFDGIYTEC